MAMRKKSEATPVGGARPRRRDLIQRMAVVVVLLLLPLSVHAQSDSKLRGYLLSVKRLYAALEYEKALEQITRAKRFAGSMEEDVTLSLYEGIILADMNREEDSTAAFKAALFLDPDAKLPLDVSPKVAQHFEAVRQEVRSEITKANPPSKTQARPETARSPALPAVSAKASPSTALRPQVLIPGIGGAVLLVAGGTSWALSRHERSRLRADDPTLATREDVRRSASRGRTYQAIGMGLLGAGVVSVGVATGLFFGTPSTELTLGMRTDGTSAFVFGSWP
jgi:hypothetical protein